MNFEEGLFGVKTLSEELVGGYPFTNCVKRFLQISFEELLEDSSILFIFTLLLFTNL